MKHRWSNEFDPTTVIYPLDLGKSQKNNFFSFMPVVWVLREKARKRGCKSRRTIP
jgi:hypothetical protein